MLTIRSDPASPVLGVHTPTFASADNRGVSGGRETKTSLISQEANLNMDLRTACADLNAENLKLPESELWVRPVANRTTAPVPAMDSWYKRADYQCCIEKDRLRLHEAVNPRT